MQGFQPAARRLAQLPAHPQNFADGGAVGFGSRGLSGLRQMIPHVQAMGYPQAAPAPAAPAEGRAAALRAMIPQVEAMGYKQASAGQPQYFAEGGVVRGPGTGTSDSIEDEVPPGTFIMPADSTAAIGPSALERMGTVPVRLSNGEFEVPPEQVMAIGAAVLKAMKDATHAPVNGVDGGQTDDEVAQAQGFSPSAAQRMQEMPEQLFADGGLVDPARRPTSFGDAAAVAADPGTTQVRTSAADTYGRAPAPAPAPAAPAPALGSNLAAATRMGSFTDPRSTLYDPNPYAAANAAKLAGSGLSSRATVEAGMPPAPAPVTARNSFGDAAAATGDAGVTQVAGGYQPGRGTVSMVPAQPLSARAPVPAAPAVAAAAQPAAGFQTAAQRMAAAPAPAAPMGWADRNARRNLEVSASSIMDSPARRAAQAALAPPPPAAAPAPAPTAAAVPAPAPAAGGFQTAAQRMAAQQPQRFADGGLVEDDLQKRLAQIPSGGPAGWTGGGAAAVPQPVAPAPAPVAAPAAPAGALSRAASYVAPAPEASLAARAMSAPPQPRPLEDRSISTQSMDAAQSLARRGAADAMAQMPNAPAPVQTPVVQNSDNSWQARNNLRNLEVSASSIMNNGGRWDQHKGPSPESLAYRAAVETDNALRGSAPALAMQGMKEQGDTQRAGLQVTASSANAAADRMGALDRTLITERGNNSRAGIAAQAGMEEARIRAAEGNKPPAGYRWAPGGKLEPIPGGPAADGKPLTEDQAKSAGYALRMDNALKLIDEVGKTNPGAIRPGTIEAVTNALPETLANSLRPEARQRVEAAQLDALDAALTLNTGAAYTREQLQGLSRSYFAQPGDDDKTVLDKGNRLQSLIDTARLRAGEKGAAMTDTAQAKNAARTGAASAAASAAVPGGMTRQVGTSGGRPVYEDAQGNRFIGG